MGTRPQFIKAAVLSRTLKKSSKFIETIVHTGQHFDSNMSDIFFRELAIKSPMYNLNINGKSHGQMTAHMLEALETIFIKEKPDSVLVYGDTNSTLAGALAAAKLKIPILHVEAGLRSYNKNMPEEINRVLTDHLSSLLFCPTQTSVHNLNVEGIREDVHLVGDVMYDATLYALKLIDTNRALKEKFVFLPENFALLTIHREESTISLDGFQKFLNYVNSFAKQNDLKIIFSVHPRTRKFLENSQISLNNLILIDPLSYFEIQFVLSRAQYVLTDSGGLQKEAYFHKVPCVTLRSETEWVETIEAGWNRLWSIEHYKSRQDIKDYGHGDAASKIVKIMEAEL